MHKDKSPTLTPKSSTNSFTLVELIIVIIIVGILAAIGITQYSTIVEKGRFAEARTRISVISKLAYEYYLNNGTFLGISNDDLGTDNACHSTDFYRYYTTTSSGANNAYLYARRCSSGGKPPQGPEYILNWLTNKDGSLRQYRCYPSTGEAIITSDFDECLR